MEELTYTSAKILTRNKQGELIEKRVKLAKVCEGAYITPDQAGMVDLIIEYNGIKWREACINSGNVSLCAKRVPGVLQMIADGKLAEMDDYRKEMHRRIFNPEAPAIMELHKPERKPSAPVMAMDGTIRAKCLQYNRDGNTLTEKRETLTKLCDGVYYNREQDAWGNWLYVFFFEDNGVYWFSQIADNENEFSRPGAKERLIDCRRNFRAIIKEKAAGNNFINTLQIEVMRRLGEDVAPLIASREAFLKQREQQEQAKREAEQRRDQERKEAEERRNAELLADGKERFLNNKTITAEQLELLAEFAGVKINPRTLHTIREKVTEVLLREDGAVTVWRRGKASTDGTAQVVFNVAAKLREQPEPQAAPQSTETPQISTETAKVEESPAQTQNREEMAQKCLYWDYASQSIKERENKIIKVTEHLYYSPDNVDAGSEFVKIVRCLNGVFFEQQGNAELHIKAFDSSRPEYETILSDLNAYQTPEGYIAKWQERIDNGWSNTAFSDEIVRRITTASNVTQQDETPEPTNVSAEPEKREKSHGKRQNPVIKDCLITDRPLLQRGRYGCRVKSVLFHASAMFHGECSTHIVPRIFGECSTVVATNKRQADRQADRQAPLLANQTITPCRDKRTDKRRDKQATSNSPPYW